MGGGLCVMEGEAGVVINLHLRFGSRGDRGLGMWIRLAL
jgi:hypothetical protein